MFKKSILLLILCLSLISTAFAISREFSEDLQKRNQAILEEAQKLTGRERKLFIERKKYEYQSEMLRKQQELYFLERAKHTIDYQERHKKINDLKEEIKELHRAEKNLR